MLFTTQKWTFPLPRKYFFASLEKRCIFASGLVAANDGVEALQQHCYQPVRRQKGTMWKSLTVPLL